MTEGYKVQVSGFGTCKVLSRHLTGGTEENRKASVTRTADKAWSSRLLVGLRADDSSLQTSALRNVAQGVGLLPPNTQAKQGTRRQDGRANRKVSRTSQTTMELSGLPQTFRFALVSPVVNRSSHLRTKYQSSVCQTFTDTENIFVAYHGL